MMTFKEIHPEIRQYLELVLSGVIVSNKEQKDFVRYVMKIFETEDIHIDKEQLNKYLDQVKYFPYAQLFPWEKCVLGLHCCTYKQDGRPRWPDLFLLIGRGAGKDGYIAFESYCLIGPYNGIKRYDVDICANSEEQAKAPFDDIWNMLEDPANIKKLSSHFTWTKEEIISTKTKARLKYRTNNPKGKDGLRSGIVVFNEIHQYQNYDNINVFTTGLGKKQHPRRTYATTNGDVRDGPLDDMVDTALQILNFTIPDNGMLPFICKLDDKKDVDDPNNWQKANPSLPYLPDLMDEISKEYVDWKRDPSKFTAFMTKRMNIPDGTEQSPVTDWDNIKAAKEKDIPDMKGHSAVAGIDYAMLSDMASVNIHFKLGEERYDISHSWLCEKSKDIPRLKVPWREWVKQGRLTLVEDVEINPDLLTEYIREQAQYYNITGIGIDNFRYALFSRSLEAIGFDAKERKNVKLIRPSDIMKIVPVISSAFVNKRLSWGKNPVMSWAANNAKLIKVGKKTGEDLGNYVYGKIEAKSRKTDPFMAFVHSMVMEETLPVMQGGVMDIDVVIY